MTSSVYKKQILGFAGLAVFTGVIFGVVFHPYLGAAAFILAGFGFLLLVRSPAKRARAEHSPTSDGEPTERDLAQAWARNELSELVGISGQALTVNLVCPLIVTALVAFLPLDAGLELLA